MKKQAFTLSEVLLVVGIIGVIASVTIPAVTTSNQNKKFSALTRKAQSTLQGAIDNKMAYTIKRPNSAEYGNRLFAWLVADEQFNWDTIKFVDRNAETISTPDGMVFYADGGEAGGKLKYSGTVYVDLNGAEDPTKTTINNGDNLDNAADDARNFDVISFNISPNGDVTTNNTKAKKYLEQED